MSKQKNISKRKQSRGNDISWIKDRFVKVFRFYNWSMITFSRWSQVQMKLVSLSVKFFASEEWTHTWTSTASVWWGSCGVEAGEVSYITLLWLFGKIQQRERTCEHADCKQLHQPSVFAANTASEDTAAASICSCWSLRLLQMPHTCDYFAKCSSWTRGRSLVQLHFIKGSVCRRSITNARYRTKIATKF